jgi:hypothetical protein
MHYLSLPSDGGLAALHLGRQRTSCCPQQQMVLFAIGMYVRRLTAAVLATLSISNFQSSLQVSTQRVLSKVVTPDQVYCLDMRVDGEAYAAAGKDKVVRIYDESTGAVQTTFRSGGYDVLGHSNRVFAVKFHPGDPNTLVSGGWDNTVILWDVRSGGPATSLFGPHICGDALDIYDHLLLAGSWRPDHQLQIFDLRMLKDNEPAVEVPWTGVAVGSGSSAALANRLAARGAPALIYAAAFSPSGTYIAAGGSGSNEAKLFDTSGAVHASMSIPSTDIPKQTPAYPTPTLCGTVAGLSRSVYSLHFSADDGLVVAGGDYLLSYELQGVLASTSMSAAAVEESSLAFGGAASRVTLTEEVKARPLTATEEAAILAAYGGDEPEASDDEADVPETILSPGARFGIAEKPL